MAILCPVGPPVGIVEREETDIFFGSIFSDDIVDCRSCNPIRTGGIAYDDGTTFGYDVSDVFAEPRADFFLHLQMENVCS